MGLDHLTIAASADKDSTESHNSDPITTKNLPKKIRESPDPTEESFADSVSSPALSVLSCSNKSKLSREPNKPKNDP